MTLQAPASNGYSGGSMTLSWKNDAEYLYLALNGTTRGWVSVGFEPTVWMKDADIVIGSVDNGRATVLDENCTGNYGPHENDTLLGGTYDILESGGMETGGNTVIELKRKMNTGDKFDKAFVPGQQVPIIWAMADTTDNSDSATTAVTASANLAITKTGPAAVVGDITHGRREGPVVATFQMMSDVGAIAGPRIAGAIVVATGSYETGFLVGVGVLTVRLHAMRDRLRRQKVGRVRGAGRLDGRGGNHCRRRADGCDAREWADLGR